MDQVVGLEAFEVVARVPESTIDFAHEVSCGFAASYIRRKAREIARQTPTWLADVHDIRQQLTLQLWERLSDFNRERGCFNAFVKLVVERDVANLKRDLARQSEERRDECSLSTMVTGCDGVLEPLANVIGDRELDVRRGQCALARQQEVALAHDVAVALDRLPRCGKKILCRLMTHSPSQVARDVRCSRSTVYAFIRRARRRFAEAGLCESSKNLPGASDLLGELSQ